MGPAPSKPIEDVSDMRCNLNSYFNKVQTRSGNLVDQLKLWCKNSNTPMIKGGNGGGENAAFECERGFDEIKFRAGPDHIDSIQLHCSDGRWSPRWGGNLGDEYHRKDCSDKNQVIVGLNSIGKRNGILANGTDISKTIECGDRINCLSDVNLFNEECKFKTDSKYKEAVRNYCNRNDENALSSECINWCKNNSTQCTRYNDLTDCKKYGITTSDCTRANIDKIIEKCEFYKIIQSDVGNTGIYPCNVNAVIQHEKECNEYNVPLDSCSPDSLQNAKDMALSVALRQEAENKAAERYNQTQLLISQTLALETEEEPKPKKKEEDYTIVIIIIIIALSFLMMLSLSSGLLLVAPGEE